MKKTKLSSKKSFTLLLCLCASILVSACTRLNVSQFEVQRPSRITIPRDVKKVFIRADLVDETMINLALKIKSFNNWRMNSIVSDVSKSV